MGDENEQKAEQAAERAEQAAERAEDAGEAAVIAEVIAETLAESGDRGRVYDDQEREDAQIAALNGGLAFLEARVAQLENIARRQGYLK